MINLACQPPDVARTGRAPVPVTPLANLRLTSGFSGRDMFSVTTCSGSFDS